MDRPLERNSISAICFDAVGTLIYPSPSAAEVYWRVGREFGSRLDLPTVKSRFSIAFRRIESATEPGCGEAAAESQLITSEPLERQRWRQIVSETIPDLDDPQACFEALWNHFAQPQHWRLFDDVTPALERLLGLGLHLVMASNFDGRLHPLCTAFPMLSKLSPRFVSSELGHRKPSRQFYRQIASRLNLPPQSLLMVGDDPEFDFAAARRADWQAILLDRDPRHRTEDSPSPAGQTSTISTLMRLADLLETDSSAKNC